jgi:hypothetical protein
VEQGALEVAVLVEIMPLVRLEQQIQVAEAEAEATLRLVVMVVRESLLFLTPVYKEVLAVLLLQSTGTPFTPLRLAQPPLRHKEKT